MSLSFAQATTNKVTVTNPLTFGSGTAFTYIQWVKQRAVPANSQGTSKGGCDLFVFSSNWFTEVPRATTTSYTLYTDASVFPTLNEWVFLASRYNETDGVDWYRGTLTSAPVLLSGTKTLGAGATSANTSDLWIGNRNATSSLSAAHDIGQCELINASLSLDEIVQQWSRWTNLSSTVMNLRLGENGTGTQPDYSGNGNAGTITGATLSDNPPISRPWGRQIVFGATAIPAVTFLPAWARANNLIGSGLHV